MQRYLVLGLLLFGVFALISATQVTGAPAQAYPPWYGEGKEWYYDHLNATQRKWIRQAIDYCIPRETIIEGLHLGFAVAIASPIGVNFEGVYEADVEARPYSPTQASALLQDAFGYIYDIDAEGNATHTPEPYFKMTLIAPTTNTARSQWAALISFALNNVGIDTVLKWWNWNVIMPRIFLDPVGDGYDYEHGGYDMFFVGYDATPDPVYKDYYDKDSFPPSSNCYFIEDGTATPGTYAGPFENVTALWEAIYAQPDPAVRTTLLKEYQAWHREEVPVCIIRQEIMVFGMDPSVEGFDLLHGFEENLANITMGGATSAVIAQPGDYVDFNPLQSNSYYDFIMLDNIFVELSRRRGEYNLTHAVPWAAESWVHSDDYLQWNVTIRPNIKWSDGTALTADDVMFTYESILNETAGCPDRGTLLSILGDDWDTSDPRGIVKLGPMEVQFNLPVFYPYVETVLFREDIVQKAQMELVPLANWKTDTTNTQPTMIGAGAYMFDSAGTTLPDTVALKPNPHYDQANYGHDPTMVGGGNWLPNPTLTSVAYKVVKEATVAVTGLETGAYDFIDSQMGIQAQVASIDASTWGKTMRGYEWGYQEMSFNHFNPIYGMNPHDPREMYPGEYTTTTTPTTTTTTGTVTITTTTTTTTTEEATPGFMGIMVLLAIGSVFALRKRK